MASDPRGSEERANKSCQPNQQQKAVDGCEAEKC